MTSQSYTATAGQDVFSFTFPFISAAHLQVTVDEVVESNWSLTGSQEITLDTPLVGGETVIISRNTPTTSQFVEFQSPSTLRGREIDLAVKQLLYALQEQGAIDERTLQKNLSETQWDAENLPIVNIADVDEGDAAATRDWVLAQIIASGALPDPVSSQIGQGITVNLAGDWAISPIGEAVMPYSLPSQTNTQTGQLNGFLAPSQSDVSNVTWTDGAGIVPLSIGTAVGTFFRAAPILDIADIVVAAGKYEITVKGSVRNLGLYTGGVKQQALARVGLTNETGATLFDDSGYIPLAVVENLANNYQASRHFTLKHVIDVPAGVQRFNVRAFKSNGDYVVVDRPMKVFIKEIR